MKMKNHEELSFCKTVAIPMGKCSQNAEPTNDASMQTPEMTSIRLPLFPFGIIPYNRQKT
jgi:hypothetical protein